MATGLGKWLVTAAAVGVAGACSWASAQCEPTTWNLTAGQTKDVGSVTVTNDNDNIYVTYTLDYQDPACIDDVVDAEFGQLHVWVGNDLTNLPQAGKPCATTSRPAPGQLCDALGGACADATGLTTYTITIPFVDEFGNNIGVVDATLGCGTSLYVVTHAEVNYRNCDGSLSGSGDTAFGGPTDGGGCGAWWFYGSYTVCCDFGPPQGVEDCQTAFAKGGWVWTTDLKSNVEKLPSLKLTKNRWGWPINLKEPGTTTYEIWSGAGLNKTCALGNKGSVRVGTLTATWDGTNVTVCYEMTDPYNCGADAGAVRSISEVHVYAGDLPPKTTAPGQYGFTDGDDLGVYTYCVTLPLADTNGTGGVWLIAHAVVCH